jgi:hypothetical protein
MGYYSNFETVDTDIPDIKDVLAANTGNYGPSWDDDGCMYSAKWYNWDEDLQQIAYQYPDKYLIMIRYGEESPDIERAIVRNGRVKFQRPNITWPAE